MANPYIPAQDSLFDLWLLNFSTLLTANPALYGLTAGNATAVALSNTNWHAAYLLAIDPPTRTKPSVAAKDAARSDALAVVRPFAIQIRNNAGVANIDKLNLGLTVPDLTPTLIPAPTSAPALTILGATVGQHTVHYTDGDSPTQRGKKPFGVIQLQLFVAVGVAPTSDPADARFYGAFTKNPIAVNYDFADRGKVATVFGRWVTRSGPFGVAQVGPMSDGASLNIAF